MLKLSTLVPWLIHPPRLLSSALAMSTSSSSTTLSNQLALGAGCYWGTEKFIVKDFQKTYPNSIQSAAVGFMAPDPNAMENPSYRQVCSGSTGHVEVLNVVLNDPAQTLEPLLRFFYQFHDPTTLNRQGNDAGTQYASVIFVHDEEQKKIAEKVTQDLQKLVDAGQVKYSGKKITTQIVNANPFYPAHEEHQAYLEKNPSGYCNHFYRFKQWPELN
jgi:peptide-methionine (S)-S-oxide reductase